MDDNTRVRLNERIKTMSQEMTKQEKDLQTANEYEAAAQKALADRDYFRYYQLSDLARKYRGWANTPGKISAFGY